MIYSVSGRVTHVGEQYAVLEVGGVGLKIFMTQRALGALPPIGSETSVFSYLNVRENALDLFGFRTAEELRFFELLITVSGVGPRSALAVLEVGDLKNLAAAIKEGRPDLLTQAAGVGRKTAERIIVELRNKVEAKTSAGLVATMDRDADLIEALIGLGYRREQVKAALQRLPEGTTGLEVRLKAALKILAERS
ncbi:MAG TPA: Holliday junction branch migration protein RuvA [Candidatus Paceibacterota bacterium]|nr:Holliday junction branch migration protein RuvA [Candidatus Paceibacterota bacterium]